MGAHRAAPLGITQSFIHLSSFPFSLFNFWDRQRQDGDATTFTAHPRRRHISRSARRCCSGSRAGGICFFFFDSTSGRSSACTPIIEAIQVPRLSRDVCRSARVCRWWGQSKLESSHCRHGDECPSSISDRSGWRGAEITHITVARFVGFFRVVLSHLAASSLPSSAIPSPATKPPSSATSASDDSRRRGEQWKRQ